MPHQACRRHDRDAVAQPHFQRVAARMVPQRIGAEPVPPLIARGARRASAALVPIFGISSGVSLKPRRSPYASNCRTRASHLRTKNMPESGLKRARTHDYGFVGVRAFKNLLFSPVYAASDARKGERGFTLLELLVVLAILGLLIGLV